MAKTKFYVVWRGHQLGILKTWDECKKSVAGYPGAQFKSYDSLELANEAYKKNYVTSINQAKKAPPARATAPIIWQSLSVDAACSGNPGVMEYQGVDTKTKTVWFIQKHQLGTNNIGEFLAIVHGLAELKRRQLDIPIYTDSKIAISWIKQKKCKTKLDRTSETEALFKIIERAEAWLKSNSWTQQILKWETKQWGEIPADFGRK